MLLSNGKRFGLLAGAVLAALLLLPGAAVARAPFSPFLAGVYILLINLITYAAYSGDKKRARNLQRRVSERSLHLLELMGGWPAAFVTQRRLRHKCSKRSFQIFFWMIVLFYQVIAFDALQEWKLTRSIFANDDPSVPIMRIDSITLINSGARA